MENEFDNTINLSGNVDEDIFPPVMETANVMSSSDITPVQSSVIPTVQNNSIEIANSVVDESESVTEDNENKEPIEVSGNVEISVALLKDMLNTVKKVGVSNNLQPCSEVLNMLINEKGLTMITSNGSEDIEVVDRSFSYVDKSITISIDIKTFGDFVNTLSCDKVVFVYDENSGVLTVNTDTGNGEFRFPQKIDASTNLPIVNELKFNSDYNNMKSINFDSLIQLLDVGKAVRTMATKLGYNFLKGTYFSDIVASSDGIVMLLQKNIDGLSNNEFFLDADFCNLLTTVKFDGIRFKIDFAKDEVGNIKGLIVSDGRITLCGPIGNNTEFPVEVCKHYWNSNSFIKTVQLNSRVFSRIVKTVLPFINFNLDNDVLSISINGDTANIISVNGAAKETIKINNPDSYSTTKPLLVPATKIASILQTIKSETISISIDPDSDNCICLAYDDYKCIVSLLND